MENETLDLFVQAGRKRGKILISACLLGTPCRYDGKSKACPWIAKLTKYYDLIPVCPETMGGLKTPRDPAEIQEGRIRTQKGRDVTDNYQDGAYWALAAGKFKNVSLAILKENSPSCGVHFIHDGSFSGKLIPGEGVTASKLRKNGFHLIDEEESKTLLEVLEKENGK